MADADADFLQNQDSRWPIYDADFFLPIYLAAFLFFLHLIKYNNLIITNNTQNVLT